MALILIVLVLIYGILFYDYVPTGKVISDNVEYKLPSEIAKELEEFSVEENAPLNIVYELTATDLTGFKQGKNNPFASLQTNNTVEQNGNKSSGSTTNSNNSAENSTTNTNSTNSNTQTETGVPKGTFFDNGTTK